MEGFFVKCFSDLSRARRPCYQMPKMEPAFTVREQAPRDGRRARLLRLALANGLLLVALVGAAELGLRALGKRPPTTYSNLRYENDPRTGPWLLPSQSGFLQGTCFRSEGIHVNAFGMRD